MKNKLTMWFDSSKAQEVQDAIKKELHQQYGLTEADFTATDYGYSFMYDDDTNGEIEICFYKELGAFRVEVNGTWAIEVITIYNDILPDYNQSA